MGGEGKIALSAKVEFSSVPFNARKTVIGMVKLKAPSLEVNEVDRRLPIDIICCIDKSLSMTGGKLDLTKVALNFVIDQLDQRDTLGLVTYDSSVTIGLTLTKMDRDGKEKAKKAVKSFQPGTMTNLSGGLLAGLDMATKRQNPNPVCSILLFTDGLANVGITNSNQLTTITEKMIQRCPEGCTVFTFGFGEHDPNMLQSIATAGKGLYYYIESIDKIPLSFADCIGGLQSVVAQNIKLTVDALNGAQILRMLNTGFKPNGTLPGHTFLLDLGDLYSEEERDILFTFDIPKLDQPTKDQEEPYIFCQFKLEYFNVLDTNSELQTAVGALTRPSAETGPEMRDEDITVQHNRLFTVEALEKGRDLADKGRLEEAREVLHKAKVRFAETAITIPSQSPASEALSKEMDDVLEAMTTTTLYQQAGRQKLFSKALTHKNQRSNMSSASPMYENRSKLAKKEKVLFN
jgi:Mg-chelatase subunit ChlD